jgi:hypothetical protein
MKRSSFVSSAWMLASVLVSQMTSIAPSSREIPGIKRVFDDIPREPSQRTLPPTFPFSILENISRVGEENIFDVQLCSRARDSLYFNIFLTEMLLCTATVRPFEYPWIHKPPWV